MSPVTADINLHSSLTRLSVTRAPHYPCHSKEYSTLAPNLPSNCARISVDFTVAGRTAPSAKLKQSRGLFARYFCENSVSDIESARAFDSEGYSCSLVEEDGGGWRMVFDRSEADSKGSKAKKGGTKRKKRD